SPKTNGTTAAAALPVQLAAGAITLAPPAPPMVPATAAPPPPAAAVVPAPAAVPIPNVMTPADKVTKAQSLCKPPAASAANAQFGPGTNLLERFFAHSRERRIPRLQFGSFGSKHFSAKRATS